MTNEHVCEREFEFALILSGVTELNETLEDALFSSGCDDASLSMQYGAARLDFLRSAPSYKDAVLSAIRDVCKAGQPLGVGVESIDACDLVTEADIGHRVSRTRQCIQQYVNGKRGPGNFPAPVCYLASSKPLWRWCDVSFWLAIHDMIPKEVLDEAQVVSIINNTLEHRHLTVRNKDLVSEIAKALAQQCDS